jgi:hypothetical protein
MPETIPITAADLRQAMRDPRYWRPGHPEREGYRAWVGGAFRQLHEAEAQPGHDGMVWVGPYTRHHHGETVAVSGHYRHARARQDRDTQAAGTVIAEQPGGSGVESRITARDAAGGLIGRCERLVDGSQFCTLSMPDGGVVVQGLEAGEGEITPVYAPAVTYGFPVVLGAATSLYSYLQNRALTARPGTSAADTPFLLFYRGFEGTEEGARVTVGTLPPDRVNGVCPKTAEFEQRLTTITASIPREGMSPQQWGTAVHVAMRDDIEHAYASNPSEVRAGLSLRRGEERSYGLGGTTRLDIFHRVPGRDTICVYDIKTGDTALSATQAARIYSEARRFGETNGMTNVRVLVIELRRRP